MALTYGKPRKSPKIAMIFTGAWLALGSLESLAEVKTSSLERKQDAWTQLNYYSPADGFYSKGSYGTHFGLGAVAPTPSGSAESRELNGSIEQPKPRLFLGKGTPWPVDFGASFSKLEGKNALQAGAHMQWTVFEDFQMPSIALRASRSILRDYHEVKELTTDAVELGVSYGLFRYLILSAGISQQWETGVTQAAGDYLSLSDPDLPAWSRRRTTYCWGMNISPLTPFVQIGLEQSYWREKTRVSLAKVSFLL